MFKPGDALADGCFHLTLCLHQIANCFVPFELPRSDSKSRMRIAINKTSFWMEILPVFVTASNQMGIDRSAQKKSVLVRIRNERWLVMCIPNTRVDTDGQ